jgi:putative PIN family toxin of toxin-antitoxin system
MKPVRLVIDTNVVVSGLRSRVGASFRVLSLLGSNGFTPVVSVPLVVEYEKTLCDPRLRVPFTPKEIELYLNYFCLVSDCRMIHYLWRPFLTDQKDDMVLEAAVSGQCRYVVTFNIKDFAGADRFAVEPIRPKDFLVRIGELP